MRRGSRRRAADHKAMRRGSRRVRGRATRQSRRRRERERQPPGSGLRVRRNRCRERRNGATQGKRSRRMRRSRARRPDRRRRQPANPRRHRPRANRARRRQAVRSRNCGDRWPDRARPSRSPSRPGRVRRVALVTRGRIHSRGRRARRIRQHPRQSHSRMGQRIGPQTSQRRGSRPGVSNRCVLRPIVSGRWAKSPMPSSLASRHRTVRRRARRPRRRRWGPCSGWRSSCRGCRRRRGRPNSRSRVPSG